MRTIIEFFKKKWVIQLLGVIALSIIIWFIGPLIAIAGMVPLESEMVRLIVILVVLLGWILSLLWTLTRAKKADQEMMQDISQADTSGASDQSEEELQILKERFDEALGVLKKARKGGKVSGSQYLYELPWYIIIGPPGSGKTTALVNSGLNFPLSDQFGRDAIRGVGGTRNCDWWFSEEAILLDTAGRYTTQDSHEAADSSAWLGFLDLIKKHRKRRPINGILIAVSIADLMLQTEAERDMHARAIRNRIEELSKRLGIRAPIYMTFTKCDLVAGFTEFYDDLGREDRAQVWGMTLPLDEGQGGDGVNALFPQEFDALLQRTNDRMLWRMHQERDTTRRTLIYGFPQEMAALKEPINRFIGEIFRPSRYQERPLLRGVYLTSGTQEGTPIDRLMGNLAASFGLDRINLPAFSGRGRSYFIQDLFRAVAFPEANLVGTNRGAELRRAWLQRGAYAGALILTVLTALAWTTSFTQNQTGIANLEANVGRYQQEIPNLPYRTTDFDILLSSLDDVRSASEVYGEDVPWLMGMGLYQGKKLDPAAHGAYQRVLEGRFLYSLGARLEEFLQNTGQEDLLREALRTYLMLGHPERLQADDVKLFMSLDWANSLPNQSDKQNRLLAHLDTLLNSNFKPLPLNESLVQQARLVLTRVPLSRQIYARIQKEAAADHSRDFLLSSALGRHGDAVFTYSDGDLQAARIPALYTHSGYYELFKPANLNITTETFKESWVLDDDAIGDDPSKIELSRAMQEVEELYLEDYIAQWRRLLGNLSIVKLRNLSHTVEVLDVASGPSTPLRKLLAAVERNTFLSRPPAGGASGLPDAGMLKGVAEGAAVVSTAASTQKNRLERLMSAADTAGVGGGLAKAESPALLVDRQFEDLNALSQKRGDNPAPLDGLIGDLADLFAYLSDLEAAGGGLSAAKQRAGGGKDPIKTLQRRARRLPKPVNSWVLALSDRGRKVVVGDTKNQLSRMWAQDVLPLCKTGIQGRFPLSKDPAREVTLQDFANFFGPGQLTDSFFNEHIKPFADTNRTPWRWRKTDGHPMGASNRVLRQFEEIAKIRDTFFAGGGKQPRIRFGLKPVFLDSKSSRFVLDLDGQKLAYRHGPARTTKLTWPPPDGTTGRSKILFEDVNGGTFSQVEEGVWGWFKLLKDADVKETPLADRFLVTFTREGHKIELELKANSVINPFRMRMLESFNCPNL
ncbi:MAG: type VI secretion system membrane subunit TssM [Candidatus Sedimenticola sp. (ex Thyasira tokunagai)]